MFGYVIPDKPNMFVKDFTLYRAYYCGLCKSIGKNYGQLMRFSTNYDSTFLNALLHNLADKKPVLKKESCVLSPLKKRPIVVEDDITKAVSDVNTMLVYYKLKDNVEDDKSTGAKLANFALVRRKYKKAKSRFPQIDSIMAEGFAEQSRVERSGEQSAEKAAHPFADMLARVTAALAKTEDADVFGLVYNLGKWIYIMDAVDDAAEDFKKNRYNPFLVGYGFKDRASFIRDRREELEFLLGSAQRAMSEHFERIQTTESEGVLTNVLWYGIGERGKQILGSNEKCKKIRI